ncbi:hypothetical protein TNCV_5105411 [Trichonephila clavipes]|nr:hypothetical protein TNCV_5105411 [Trichonephila clavipes]
MTIRLPPSQLFFFLLNLKSPGHPEQWLVTLSVVPKGLGSNPGEAMDVCKRIVSLWHGVTLNNRRAASPLARLMEGEERWEAHLTNPRGAFPES